MTYVEGFTPPANINLENFLGLQNEVLAFGFNDGPQVNRSRIKGWLNEAQGQIAREVEGPEYQETEVIETEVGRFAYPMEENYLRTQSVYFPEFLTRLRMWDLQQHDEVSSEELQGPPALYTIYRKEMWLYPIPNQTYELKHRFIVKPPAMVQDTDVPILDPDYWYLLISWALWRAFMAEDDQESAQAHKNVFKEQLDAYASDVQHQMADRPNVVGGMWAGGGYSTW